MNRKLICETDVCDLFIEVSTVDDLYVHVDMQTKAWTASVYKRMLSDFAEVLEALHEKGVKELFVLSLKADTALIKFASMFGFAPDRETGQYLRLRMELE